MANNASATAQSETPTYPRGQHSKWCQLLIWAACASLVICGLVAFICSFLDYKYLSHVFLSFYFIVFGVIVIVAEMRAPFATRCFGFLCTKFGVGAFFIFAGTLGISFGVSKSAGVLVPFVSGICWCVVGVLCITDTTIQSKSAAAGASVEGV